MSIFATSDTHFGHTKLVTIGRRPRDFGERLLSSIAENSGDMLVHCGDFCIGQDARHVAAYMAAAAGFKHKVLVRGNHDQKGYAWYLSHGFDFVCEMFFAEHLGKRYVFSHMPMKDHPETWGTHWPPRRNLHGHLHGGSNHRAPIDLFDPNFHYDLAPETHDYKIVNIDFISYVF